MQATCRSQFEADRDEDGIQIGEFYWPNTWYRCVALRVPTDRTIAACIAASVTGVFALPSKTTFEAR